MNCKVFRHNVTDWVSHHLEPDQAAAMQVHQDYCADCAQVAAQERALRAAWRALPDIQTPDISSRLHARLNVLTPARRFSFLSRPALAIMLTFALTGCFWSVTHPTDGRTDEPEDTSREAAVQKEPAGLKDMLTSVRWDSSNAGVTGQEPPAYNRTERALLLPGEKSR